MFPQPSEPAFAVPDGATDCHVHVFGDAASFPPAAGAGYTPLPATVDDLLARMEATGVRRAVIVQPSAYGDDNCCTLGALAAHPERLRGVAVIRPDATRDALERLHACGVRGVRLNLVSPGALYASAAEAIDTLARLVAPLGWHLQVFISAHLLPDLAGPLASCPADLVFDHMGKPEASLGADQPGLRTLRGLLAKGRTWVKLSGPYRTSRDELGNADVTAVARALVAENPERIVWGSDWPHIGDHTQTKGPRPPDVVYRKIDYGRLLSILPEWVPDDGQRRRILVDNPRKLYGFAA